jgi:hypothetical protein
MKTCPLDALQHRADALAARAGLGPLTARQRTLVWQKFGGWLPELVWEYTRGRVVMVDGEERVELNDEGGDQGP